MKIAPILRASPQVFPRINYNLDNVNKTYRQLVKENHPDMGGSNEKMIEINTAKDFFDDFFKSCASINTETNNVGYPSMKRMGFRL